MSEFDVARFAVIADVHGNSNALEAVSADIAAQAIGSVVNLGDHLSGPMAARETAELLMARDMPSVRGNHDRWLVENNRKDMISIDRAAYDQLDASHLAWLEALPPTLRLSEEVFACHGTPGSDTTYWLEAVTSDGHVVLRDRDAVAADATGVDASLMLCGHTHIPRRVDLHSGRVILNPGSVGCPAFGDAAPFPDTVQTDTGTACYAVVRKTSAGWATVFRHIPYDPRRMIEMVRAVDYPNWETRLATGWLT